MVPDWSTHGFTDTVLVTVTHGRGGVDVCVAVLSVGGMRGLGQGHFMSLSAHAGTPLFHLHACNSLLLRCLRYLKRKHYSGKI
ncbi:hypothetical protein E2C01_043427 [Portunus trituberculatus]|uniref:Uncharacterized protein n=1 Tax=Portunus trituberculatus TaxID=210409 RepID=A0A5B7FWP7_PORTR|nr:hypothetical protein [Portunus trituberculatus]